MAADDTLRITTQVNIGALTAGMNEAASSVSSSTGQMSAGFQKVAAESVKADVAVARMGSSMGMARVEAAALTGSTGMLAGGLARLVASSAALGPLIMAAFPVLGAIAIGKLLVDLADSFDKAKIKAADLQEKSAQLVITTQDLGTQIQIENLRLQDTIAALEGRPATNKLSEALLEAKLSADKLGESLAKDMREQIDLFNAEGAKTFTETIGEQGLIFKDKDVFKEMIQAYRELEAARLTASKPMQIAPGLQDAFKGMAPSVSIKGGDAIAQEGQTEDALKKQQAAYEAYAAKVHAAMEAVQQTTPSNIGLILQLSNTYEQAKASAADFAEQIKNTQLHAKVGGIEDSQSAAQIEKRIALIKSEAEEQEKLATARATAAHSSAEQTALPGKITATDEAALEQQKATSVFEIQHNSLQQQIVAYSQFAGKYSTQIKELKDRQLSLEAEYGAKVGAVQAAATAANLKQLDEESLAVAEYGAKAFAADLAAEKKYAQEKISDQLKLDEQLLREQKESAEQQKSMQSAQRGLSTAGLDSGPVKSAIQGAFIKQDQALQQQALSEATASVAMYSAQLAQAQAALDKLTASGANEATASEKERAAWEAANNELNKTKSVLDQATAAQSKLQVEGVTLATAAATNAISFQTAWVNAIQNATNAFNRSFIQWVDKGGSAMKMLTSMAEAMTNTIIEWALKETEAKVAQWTIQKIFKISTEAASVPAALAAQKTEAIGLVGLAGAGGVASMAAAPFPLDLSAPAFGAAMAGAAAGFAVFEEGGIVPSTGFAMLHAKEMVLPAHISEGIQQSMGPSGGGGSTREGSTIHNHFSSNLSATDTAGMARLLSQHEDLIMTMVARSMRRKNL
jgi:hypothetical protein